MGLSLAEKSRFTISYGSSPFNGMEGTNTPICLSKYQPHLIMNRTRFLLVFTFLYLGLTALVSHATAQADDDDRRVLTVSAQSSVDIPTTHARITVMIEAREKTPKEAQASIARRSNPVMDYLKSADVQKLQTAGLSLNPIIEYHKNSSSSRTGRNEIVGYSAQWSTSFEVPVERAGEVADQVVAEGADRIANFQLKATDQAVEAARTEALGLAARSARDRGEAVLASLGHEMDEVIRIQIIDTGSPYPMRAMRAEAMSMAADSSAPTAIEGGLQTIRGSVQLEVAY